MDGCEATERPLVPTAHAAVRVRSRRWKARVAKRGDEGLSVVEGCAPPTREEPDQAAHEEPSDDQGQNSQNDERGVRHQEVGLKRRWHALSMHGLTQCS
jgi:hypothetical protein